MAPLVPVAVQENLTAEAIRTARQEIEQAAELDGELKQRLLQAYDQAAAFLDAAARSARSAADSQHLIETAAAEAEHIGREGEELGRGSPQLPSGDEPLETLKTVRGEKELALAKAKEEAAAVEAELARRITARQEIPNRIAEARKRLARIDQQLREPLAPDTPEPLLRVQVLSLLAEKKALEGEIAAGEKELLAFDASADLLPLRQKLATARAARLEAEVKAWRQAESRLVEQDARRRADEARRAALGADPALQALANDNQALAEIAESLASDVRQEVTAQNAIKEQLDGIEKQFQRARDRVEAVGLTNAIGQLLRAQKTNLPDLAGHYREARLRQARIRAVQIKLFELEARRSDARGLEQQYAEAMRHVGAVPTAVPPQELESAVRAYLAKRAEYLDLAIKNHYEFLRMLGDSEVVQRQLIHETEAFADYIGERVLWIRSAETLGLGDLVLSLGILRTGVCPGGWAGWRDVVRVWLADARQYPLVYLAMFCLLLSWAIAWRRVGNSLARLGRNAATSAQVRIWPTIQALLATVLVGSVGPVFAFCLGLRLALYQDSTEFARAVGSGCLHLAAWWLPLTVMAQLCRPQGLAESHFAWPGGAIRAVRLHLRWFTVLGLPLVFLIALVEAQGIARWQNALGRGGFLILVFVVAVFAHMLLRPAGAALRHFRAAGDRGWILRHPRLLHWSTILIAGVLGLGAFFGYYYTAYRLGGRVRETVLLTLALTIASALISRWGRVARRRLAIERMRQRRAAESTEEAAEGLAVSIAPAVAAEQAIDLAKVSDQTRRFVNSLLLVVGVLLVWWIWIEVLPALAFLDRLPLWRTTITVTEPVALADGETAVRSIQKLGFVSLADLILAVIVGFVTIIGAKNLPGLLEISLPKQLPLDAGARYAITTLTRYGVIALGIVVGFNAIGFSWSNVQWLVAALTVGLGFGLQEIFANFVSGLILLFERPIRVGDIVTVDGTTGVVSRIQTRATTVTNWDRQDLIVPNKEFITGRLLNWTRSDHVNRIVINVGIAYGSDTELARRLIEEVLREHSEVLGDPPSIVTFEGFGESTLNLVARCYLAKLDNRLRTIHDLHTGIDQAFRKAGIEIAFPQRGIHLRTTDGPWPQGAGHAPASPGTVAGASRRQPPGG